MEAGDEHKLEKLKGLLGDAVQQIRRKLDVVEKFVQSLKDIDSVNNDTKLICTLLIEVKELLKNFPAIYAQPRAEPPADLPRFVRFQHNVVEMIEDVRVRLYSVEEFYQATDSLPKAMTVAVTIRDITKHLKVVSSRGPRIVNLPSDSSNVDPSHSPEVSTSVVDIVQYYTSLEKGGPPPGQLTARSGSIPEIGGSQDSQYLGHAKPSRVESRPKRRNRRQRRMTMEEAEAMDHAVTEKMSTLSRNRAELFENMLNQKSMKTIFDTETAVKKAAIVRYLDATKLYRSGYMKKQTYTMKSFGKSSKTYWWILDSEHLSCFQSQNASLPLKSYRLDELTHCSWEGKLSKTASKESFTQISLVGKHERKLILSAESTKTLMAWVAAIDSVQTYKEMPKTILNPIEKHLLLQWVYQEEFKGGEIKSSYDEEWRLSSSGVLKSAVGIPADLAYRWDGEMLIGLNEISANLGSGKWDGVSLVWYDEAANGVITTPSIRYDWDCQDREYINPIERHQAWVWSRNFLVSKFGAGEWIVDGVIPEPVVMFLQMMRTSRLQRMVEAEREEQVYNLGRNAYVGEDAPAPPPGIAYHLDFAEGSMPLPHPLQSPPRAVGFELQAPVPDPPSKEEEEEEEAAGEASAVASDEEREQEVDDKLEEREEIEGAVAVAADVDGGSDDDMEEEEEDNSWDEDPSSEEDEGAYSYSPAILKGAIADTAEKEEAEVEHAQGTVAEREQEQTEETRKTGEEEEKVEEKEKEEEMEMEEEKGAADKRVLVEEEAAAAEASAESSDDGQAGEPLETESGVGREASSSAVPQGEASPTAAVSVPTLALDGSADSDEAAKEAKKHRRRKSKAGVKAKKADKGKKKKARKAREGSLEAGTWATRLYAEDSLLCREILSPDAGDDRVTEGTAPPPAIQA